MQNHSISYKKYYSQNDNYNKISFNSLLPSDGQVHQITDQHHTIGHQDDSASNSDLLRIRVTDESQHSNITRRYSIDSIKKPVVYNVNDVEIKEEPPNRQGCTSVWQPMSNVITKKTQR